MDQTDPFPSPSGEGASLRCFMMALIFIKKKQISKDIFKYVQQRQTNIKKNRSLFTTEERTLDVDFLKNFGDMFELLAEDDGFLSTKDFVPFKKRSIPILCRQEWEILKSHPGMLNRTKITLGKKNCQGLYPLLEKSWERFLFQKTQRKRRKRKTKRKKILQKNHILFSSLLGRL